MQQLNSQQLRSIAEALAEIRSRQSWNDRLAHWEKPASDSEEATIERAATMVREVMKQNPWFVAEGIQIVPQGSYHNNTNVRQEADMDLRAMHSSVYLQYAPGVIAEYAHAALGYRGIGRTVGQVADQMRIEIAVQLAGRFGLDHVDASGNKAIRLKKIAGSRADVDIVPCLVLDYVVWNSTVGIYQVIKGVAILGRAGGPTLNFPDQHYANGVAKRLRTRLRFKKNVRMIKRLRDELVESGVLQKGDVPSFLVECLVYGVEDSYFLVETDDRFDRLRRVVLRMNEQLNDPVWPSTATEINEVKLLFGAHQPWTAETAKRFTMTAWNRLVV
jgi:hypothetical protein